MLNNDLISRLNEFYCFDFLSNSFCSNFFSDKGWKRNIISGVPYKMHTFPLIPIIRYVLKVTYENSPYNICYDPSLKPAFPRYEGSFTTDVAFEK